MDSLQQSVKITDGMLRALIQRLSSQIDGMGPSLSASAAKQLEASLIQVQRVQEKLESSLSRVLEHEEVTKNMKAAAVNRQTESAESALVTDRLNKLAAIFGGPDANKSASDSVEGNKILGRLEAKLDALINVTNELDEDRKAREGDKVDERLHAIQATLTEMRNSTAGTANHSNNNAAERTPTPSVEALLDPEQASSPDESQQASSSDESDVVGRDRKRKRQDGEEKFALPHHVQLSEEDQEKFDELAEMRSVTDTLLGQLLPCPDGGAWDTARIFELFRSLFKAQNAHEHIERLREFMDDQPVHVWCCVRRAAVDGIHTVSYDGTCSRCRYRGCVQLRRAAEEGFMGEYYYVRVIWY
jgi:hypothetical protein